MFEIKVRSTSETPTVFTLVQVMQNPYLPSFAPTLEQADGHTLLVFASETANTASTDYGALAFGTNATGASCQHAWFRGNWFDSLEVYWSELRKPGPFADRRYPEPSEAAADHALIAVSLPASAFGEVSARFAIAWYNPNCRKYWATNNGLLEAANDVACTWRNFYATQWPSAQAVASHALAEWDRLYSGTALFRDALYRSTLPHSVLDAVAANVSILKSSTVLRLQDGTFYGWEGCHPNAGSCEGSCTHVWNYQQALPFLFPRLERSMRDADFRYNQDPIGGMAFRLQLPLGIGTSDERPCADGQFGGVMKTYRDWKISGDTEWLRERWPAVKASIEYAWHPNNLDRWDPDQTGVLWGRQHHTLDMELFGPSSWLCGFYLGALKAGAEIAGHLGDDEAASRFEEIYERGRDWVDGNLFNGRYFSQRIDLSDRSVLAPFTRSRASRIVKGSVYDLYWDDEHGELKYQIGGGCIIDQVLAQWHANLYRLGDLFDPIKTSTALRSILQHNYFENLGEIGNPCRVFAIEGEAGTIICAWPPGIRRPAVPIPYAQETMHGYEYAFGSALMQYGMVREGVAVFRAVRNRYDGSRRNPWNEIECGSNYARSMASYAGLLVLSGFTFDLVQGEIGFAPKVRDGETFRSFWSVGEAWGEILLTCGQADLVVHHGSLELRKLGLPMPSSARVRGSLNGRTVDVLTEGATARFPSPLALTAGDRMTVISDAISLEGLPDVDTL